MPGGGIVGITEAQIPVWLKAWLEPEVLVPILATIVVLVVGIVVICVTLARRHQPHRLRGQKDVYCMYAVAWRLQAFSLPSILLFFAHPHSRISVSLKLMHKSYWFTRPFIMAPSEIPILALTNDVILCWCHI